MTQEISEELPTGVQLTVLDENFRTDPYPILENIRSNTRVLNDVELGMNVCTHHDDVKEILRNKSLWTDPRKANPGTFFREFLGGNEDREPSMLLMDEPDHRRLRSLVSKPFTPAAVEKWRPRTKTVIQKILNEIRDDQLEFDLIAAFAGPIPTVVIAEMLGIDPEKHEDFKKWSDLSVKVAFNPFPTEEEQQKSMASGEALENFFVEEIAARRTALGDDLLSDLIRAEEAGETLTTEEIIGTCNLLLVAGNVTTTDLIGNGVKALLMYPEQLQKLKGDPSLIVNAVEEMLRFDAPVTNSGRIVNETGSYAGCPIEQGENLMTSLAAANRDPSIYPEPNVFDIEREDTHHQSFGGGRHLCLGAHLARLEAQEAILALIKRFPDLVISDRGYRYSSIPSFRGMEECWVRV